MEPTETQPTPMPAPEPMLVLTHDAQIYLREAGKWASFLSIIGFIFCGLILIMAVSVGSVFTVMSRISPAYSQFPIGAAGGLITVIYILIDILYFFFPLYLYKFSSRAKKGVVYQDAIEITRALASLKSFFKLWGIVTIVMISIYILIFLFFIVIGVGTHMIHG